jgi:HrpA-like RNA helicase
MERAAADAALKARSAVAKDRAKDGGSAADVLVFLPGVAEIRQ